MELRAEELRIGNYVYDSTDHCRIDIKCSDFCYTGNFEPIPLTEEWLLKFGFVKLGDGYDFWDSSVFNIEFIRNHWHVCYTSNVLCTHIKHVHQLQNFYFALTGEELTIKNNG